MAIGPGQHLGIRGPAITEKQRGFPVTVLFNLLDELLPLFLRSLPVMHRLNKAAARQDINKRPSITYVLPVDFVCAEMPFFFKIYDQNSSIWH